MTRSEQSLSELKRLKKVPRYLIPGHGKFGRPGMIKRHVADLCAPFDEQWRLFSESCLRNKFFREIALKRSPKCKACDRSFDKRSRIEQHHNDYLWACIGETLPDDSPDIHRSAVENEYKQVPDCRRCFKETPDQFRGCQSRIFPVHAACHERIHDKERYFRRKAKQELLEAFSVNEHQSSKRV